MACRRGFNSRKNRKNNQWSRSLFSLSVVSSRYNIERHNFPREVSLNVVNYWLPGFHRPVYTGRRRKSPRGRRLGGRENRRGRGGLGRQPSFDHSDKVSEGKKSRKSQTNKRKRSRKRRVKNSRRKKSRGKLKNEHEICHMALRTCETIRLRFVDPIEFKVQIFLMSFLSRSIHNRKCMCRWMFLSVSARSPIFPKYTSLIKNILVVTSKRAIDET